MRDFSRIAAGPGLEAAWTSAPLAAAGLTYTGSSGDDSQVGTGADDVFNYGQGGDDTVFGGAGDDRIDLGGSFTGDDRINGGSGYDILSLKGDYYSFQAILGPMSLFGVEEIRLGGGFDYAFNFDEANLAGGEVLKLDARKLGADKFVIFNAGDETDATFTYVGGEGHDEVYVGRDGSTVATGGGDDFMYMFGDYAGATRFNGGLGRDALFASVSTSKTVALGARALAGVEELDVTAAVNAGDVTFHLVLNDANVAAGQRLFLVGGAGPNATLALFWDGSAERDGSFQMWDGFQDDTLVGGRGGDTLRLAGGGTDWARGGLGDDILEINGATLEADDRIDGGKGRDVLKLFGEVNGIELLAQTIIGIERIELAPDASYRIGASDATAAGGRVMEVDGSAITAGHTLFYDATLESDAAYRMDGGAGDDTLIGGALGDAMVGRGGGDRLCGAGGADRLTGGGGGDVFLYRSLAETPGNGDLITDFVSGSDVIDLSLIDANAAAPKDQAFHLGATDNQAGDLIVRYIAADDVTEVRLYVDGDRLPDAVIRLEGDHHLISAGDFVL